MERVAYRETTQRAQRLILAFFTLARAISAFAQTAKPAGTGRLSGVVLVSIADRKLAVIEDGNLIATFPVAVGAASSPQSHRKISNRKPRFQSHLIPRWQRDPWRQRQSHRNSMGGTEPEAQWDSRHECAAVCGACGLARLHAAAPSRQGAPVHRAASRR
jgi:L,D-transpeptidase catalytic domain